MGVPRWLSRLWGSGQPAPMGRTRAVRLGAALHDAAASSRRLRGWDPTSADVSTIAASSGDKLLKRSRDLVLGNAYAANAKEEFAASLVGTGIRPASTIQDEALQTRVMQLWADWCDVAEEQGSISFYGIQDVVAGAVFEAGEVFVRLRPRRPEDGLPVPLQLQVLESEYCDRAYTQDLGYGRQVKSGIEVDLLNRRLAYWFWRQHPGDRLTTSSLQDRVRVPAESVIHVFDVLRPSQLRGLPKLAPGMVRLRILDDYDDAELERKKTAALIAAWVTRPDAVESFTEEQEATNDRGESETRAQWEPGTLHELFPGEDIKFSEPADVGGNYEVFQYRNLLAIAAAIGVPYCYLTGDVKQANYSSLRADMVRFRRRIDRIQSKVLVHQFCRQVWDRFIDAAILSRALPVAPARAEELKSQVLWIPPKWEWVDPLKDRQAEQLAIEMRVKPRSAVIIEEGGDPETIDQQIAADQARAERLGIQAQTTPPVGQPSVVPSDDQEPAEDDPADQQQARAAWRP